MSQEPEKRNIRKAIIEIVTLLIITGIMCWIVSGARHARNSDRPIASHSK